MKKGICIGSLPGGISVEDRFKLAKDAGFDGVEISSVDDKSEGEKIKKAADAAGVEIPSIMGGLHWQCPLSSADEETRRKCMKSVERSLELANEVGANTVLLVPGVVNEEVRYEEAYERSLNAIKELAQIAEERKVFIGIENVWNKFLLSPMEFCKFVDEVNSEYVQAYFDVGNIVIYGYPQHWIRSLGERIKKVHVKGFNANKRDFVYLLEGSIDWPAVMAAFREIGYDDYMTAELPSYPSYPEQMVYDTSAHLDKIIGS